jgi:hypothetical protein
LAWTTAPPWPPEFPRFSIFGRVLPIPPRQASPEKLLVERFAVDARPGNRPAVPVPLNGLHLDHLAEDHL